MNFREYLTEASSDVKVYVAGKELWVGYAHGSGTATQFNKSYISSNKDGNFDLNAEKIGKWAQKEKALKSADNKKMFELQIFDSGKSPFNDDKPKSTEYMVVTDEKSFVINFFKSKKEAQAWM